MIGLPQIIINFVKLAATAITRSAKGIVCLVIKDATDTTFNVVSFNFATEVNSDDFTADNYNAIQDAFLGTPSKVIVVRVAADGDFADAEPFVSAQKFNWLAMISSIAADQQAVATYVKSKNAVLKTSKIKAITLNAAVTDDMHIVNFVNTSVKRAADAAAISGYLYLGRIAGLLAGLPFTRSSTYYALTDLESVTEPADIEAAINGGGFVIINDYGDVKIARGVNSLTTLSSTVTEDMKKIAIVEAMDTILEDVATEFKNNYLGKFKNRYDNQALFVSAVNGYFRELEKEEILDDGFSNQAGIDTAAQQAAWIASGKDEAAAWDEATIKKMTFGSKMFIAGDVKILDALEDLTFNITME